MVVDYGAPIVEVANAIRRNIIEQIEGTTGLEVVEVLKPEQVAAATADDGVVTEDDVVTR